MSTALVSRPTFAVEVFLITTFASYVQGAVGFGVALVSAPLLVMLNPHFVPVPMIVAGTYLTVLIVVRERHSVDTTGLLWAVAGRFPGIALGLLILSFVTAESMGLLVGAVVLFAVLLSGLGLRVRVRRGTLFLAGFLSGLTGTSASIGGPPMALLYQEVPGPQFRGTLSAYFIVGGATSLAALAAAGRFGVREAYLGVLLLPGVTTGFLLSNRTARWLDRRRERMRWAILSLCAVAGLVNILRYV